MSPTTPTVTDKDFRGSCATLAAKARICSICPVKTDANQVLDW
jgi:hypothetical protein